MAREERQYRYNGAAAYDVYRGQAAPQIQRPSLPEERPEPVRRKRIKVKTAVSPFALFGMLGAACMLVLVIFGYVQLYEATSQVGRLETTLEKLQEEKTNLHSVYEGKIDLSHIEERAAELGMRQPENGQMRYVNLTGSDKAEIITQESHSLLGDITAAIKDSVSGLVAYLS